MLVRKIMSYIMVAVIASGVVRPGADQGRHGQIDLVEQPIDSITPNTITAIHVRLSIISMFRNLVSLLLSTIG